MTRSDYDDRARKAFRWGIAIICVWLAFGVGGLAFSLHGVTFPRGDIRAIYAGLTGLGAVVLPLPFIRWYGRCRAISYGLICPHCGKPVVYKKPAEIDAGLCPSCSKIFLSDVPLKT
jgi:hypothetical protein